MKKLSQRISFILRLALKNIFYSKFKTAILLLMFVILSMLMIISLSTRNLLDQYFYHEKIEQFRDLDFYLTYDENSNSRYFSTRELMNQIDEDDFKTVVPFFEMTISLETNTQLSYVNVLASSIDHFNKVSELEINQLNQNEMIISKSLSHKLNLEQYDEVIMYIGGQKVIFKVVNIIEDHGLLNKNTVFIDKETNISLILSAFGLDNMNPLFTKNLYNKVYFSLNDDSKKVEIKNQIESMPTYQKFIIEDTINPEQIEDSVQKIASLFFLILTIILIGLFFVIQSTIVILFEERKAQIGITKILGGSWLFSFIVMLIEMVLLSSLSLIIARYVTQYIINKGMEYIDSTFVYHIPINHLLLSFEIILLTMIFLSIINYLKIYSSSHIQLSISKRDFKKSKPIFYAIILMLMLLGLLTNRHYLINSVSLKYYELMNILFMIVLVYSVSKYILFAINKRKHKRSLTTLVTINNLTHNKYLNHMILMMLTSFILIVILISSHQYINQRKGDIFRKFDIDYAITNIVNDLDLNLEKLKSDDKIQNIDKAYLFTNVEMNDDTIFNYLISIDPIRITKYLNIELEGATLNRLLNRDKNYVVLPLKYGYVDHYQVGDIVYLDLNQDYQNEPFIIAGFVDFGINELIITNMAITENYKVLEPNSILIQNKDDGMGNKLHQEFNYIFDFNTVIKDSIDLSSKVTNYISYLIVIIIICFMLTILNNSSLYFTNMKSYYSRFRVLGCSLKQLMIHIMIEQIILLVYIDLLVLFIYILIKDRMRYLLIFFDSYEPFNMSLTQIIFGILIGNLVYGISCTIYLYKVKKINITEVIKQY